MGSGLVYSARGCAQSFRQFMDRQGYLKKPRGSPGVRRRDAGLVAATRTILPFGESRKWQNGPATRRDFGAARDRRDGRLPV
jgi:hypothetical protein